MYSTRQYRAYGVKRGGNDYAFEPNYPGQRLDASGLLYYGARDYDPQLGAFISADMVFLTPRTTRPTRSPTPMTPTAT